jgi:hypothetical protein
MTIPSDPISPLDKDKRREERLPAKQDSKAQILGAYFLVWLRKLLDFFAKPPSSEKNLHLLSFRKGLERLQKEDLSQDGSFLGHLAEDWHFLLQDPKLQSLIQKIESYPPDSEHSFGYYLSAYAGESWLPLPFMEMVQKMHRESETSPLSEWISQIDSLKL